MRSTWTFRGVPEREQSDSSEDDSRYFSEYLANKLGMDIYEVDMQVCRAHRTPKSVYDNKCKPIFVKFVNWRYAEYTGPDEIDWSSCKQLVKISTATEFSKSLTNCRNQAPLRRKEITTTSLDLSVFLWIFQPS